MGNSAGPILVFTVTAAGVCFFLAVRQLRRQRQEEAEGYEADDLPLVRPARPRRARELEAELVLELPGYGFPERDEEPRPRPPSILAFFCIAFFVGMILLTVFRAGIPDWPVEQLLILAYLVGGERLPGGRFIADHTRSLREYYEKRRWRAGCLGLMVYLIPYVNLFFLGRPMILAACAVLLALPLELVGAYLSYYVLPIPSYGPLGQGNCTFWQTFLIEVFLTVGLSPFLVMLALHIRWRAEGRRRRRW
ncbi:MAG TPA: hypothetical protein VIL46_18225 [Gemmataceae bacterium]